MVSSLANKTHKTLHHISTDEVMVRLATTSPLQVFTRTRCLFSKPKPMVPLESKNS